MTQFDALIGDIDALLGAEETALLAKAKRPDKDDAEDDRRIKDAADGDADDDGEPDYEDALDDDDDDEDEGEPDGDEAPRLKKSFDVILPDGQAAEAYDGASLIAAFRNELAASRAETAQLAEHLARTAKLVKSLRAEDAALAQQVRTLAKGGAGRRSVLHVHERPIVGDSMAKADSVPPAEILGKALDAQRSGKITGTEVAEIDASIAARQPVREALLKRIA